MYFARFQSRSWLLDGILSATKLANVAMELSLGTYASAVAMADKI